MDNKPNKIDNRYIIDKVCFWVRPRLIKRWWIWRLSGKNGDLQEISLEETTYIISTKGKNKIIDGIRNTKDEDSLTEDKIPITEILKPKK